jgi:hypothetical protein
MLEGLPGPNAPAYCKYFLNYSRNKFYNIGLGKMGVEQQLKDERNFIRYPKRRHDIHQNDI